MTGIQIYWDMNALKETDERMFPVSKHRSKRIHKKLVKRFGGEFRKEPCIWQINGAIFAHPKFKAEFEKQTVAASVSGFHSRPPNLGFDFSSKIPLELSPYAENTAFKLRLWAFENLRPHRPIISDFAT